MRADQVWTTTDKSDWGPGPWQGEPDKIQWVDPDTDLDCLIVRGPLGALCGYVGVPPGHPWHGAACGTLEVTVTVHGGLTFSAACDEDAAEGTGICHVPAPGRPGDVWWLGFDCAHCGDLCPATHLPMLPDQAYRTVAYVQGQCARLAAQAREAAKEAPWAG